MAVELSDAGLWLGERVLPADDVGREEELAVVCAAIGMFQPDDVTLLQGFDAGCRRLGCSGACFPRASRLDHVVVVWTALRAILQEEKATKSRTSAELLVGVRVRCRLSPLNGIGVPASTFVA